MNRILAILVLAAPLLISRAAAVSSTSEGSSSCLQVTTSREGILTVRFSLPKKLATPPRDLKALADHGFSLEKHGTLPYFPVRPVTFQITSKALSMEIVEAKLVEVPDAIREAGEMPQPSIESDVLFAPGDDRPIALSVFPESSFPSQHVVVERPITFGDKIIARAKIYPFVYDEKRSITTRADLLVFRIAPARSVPAGARVKALVLHRAGAVRPLIFSVPADGICALSLEELTPWWGNEPLPLENLSLQCRGESIAYYASGDGDGLLEAGEKILFYGVGGDNIFTRDNAYWLEQEPGGAGMEALSRPPPSAGSVTQLPRQLRFQENHWMYEAQPPGTGEDHWFWEKITAPNKVDIKVELRNLADTPDFRATLKIGLQGATASHKTRVLVNGIVSAEEGWGGLVPSTIEVEFAQSSLQEGTNVVTIEELGEGSGPDIVYLDWIEVKCDSRLTVENGQLIVTVPPGVPGIVVSGLKNSDVLVFDVTQEQTPRFVQGAVVTGVDADYKVEFGTMADSERTYIILSADSTNRPTSIRQKSESRWSSLENRADWIIVTHSDFGDAAKRLASHRESQGLKTAVVDIQDVYDEFNDGVTSPEAVRKFVKFAHENWQSPAPKYLVLFGDGHADYMDWLGTHQPNFIPPHYSWIPPLGWAPDDDWFGCADGDDAFPEVFVGRLPVQSPSEAEAVVDKMIGYDSAAIPQEWQEQAVLCGSAGSQFQAICRSIGSRLPPSYEKTYLFRDDYQDAAAMKQDILKSLNAGSLLLFYVGHGSVERWSGGILEVQDTLSLANGEKLSIACLLTCLNGYFAVPGKECLAEGLFRAPSGGAVGCIAPTGTGYPSEHLILSQGIVRRLFGGATLGQCLAEGKLSSYARGIDESSLRGFGLIGDPATSPRFVPPASDLIWFY